ncbi:hypothetical protein [Paenibacillus qinlingensis]|uniref:hypothetical protein n=1 Tax=Paenibacillus qinlingensis TaxID=1837343 RepID=UPI0015640E3A|nr:hypothetical protein [Paenibacillus qinlingensis]NQX57537.1 hypothetical protein [Paenibacillus qinlingensis]
MIKRGNNIIAYFMYMPTKETAVEHYFYFVTQPDTVILLMNGFSEYRFDGIQFSEV